MQDLEDEDEESSKAKPASLVHAMILASLVSTSSDDRASIIVWIVVDVDEEM